MLAIAHLGGTPNDTTVNCIACLFCCFLVNANYKS